MKSEIHEFGKMIDGILSGLDGITAEDVDIEGKSIRYYRGSFWTQKQRQGNSLHEISYRACFKPQLPDFFIRKLTDKNSTVFDPFNGRGTTVVQSAILGRKSVGIDVNPISEVLTLPRIDIPKIDEIFERLDSISVDKQETADIDLGMFFHEKTISEILSLKNYLVERYESRKEDNIDKWIRMISTSRLTGHSSGFFSVYSLPPNQAASKEDQLRINEKLKQKPEYRDTKKIIKKKTNSLLRDVNQPGIRARINSTGLHSKVTTFDCTKASLLVNPETIDLTVTSPPFLDVVQYAKDNWLRCWFNGIDVDKVEKNIFKTSNIESWLKFIETVFKELYIITKKGGYVAFEVGEIRKGRINLDEYILKKGIVTGFEVVCVFINDQDFTKTSNIWGVKNSELGTNSNRIILMRKT